MFYLVLIYISVKLTFITQKYVIFLLAVLGHHTIGKKFRKFHILAEVASDQPKLC